MPSLPTPRFDQFYRHDALTRLLFDYAEARADLVTVSSIGKSHEGRDIWVVTVTNSATGAAHDKPASGPTATSTPPSSPRAALACTTCTSWSAAMVLISRSRSCSTRAPSTCARG